jgi:hypothetical protein
MRSSIQSTTASSLGILGSQFITGTGVFSNSAGWNAFRTVDVDTVIAGITGHSSIDGLSYLVGKTLSNYEFLGNFTNIRLTTGALQAFK